MLYVAVNRLSCLDSVKVQNQHIEAKAEAFAVPSEGILTVNLPSRASAANSEFFGKMDPGKDYLLLLASYNGRRPPKLFVADPEDHDPQGLGGAELIWEYGDGHGMRWGAVMRIQQPAKVKLSVTGHHDHGWSRYLVEVVNNEIKMSSYPYTWKVESI